mmetsp:Transcript_74644/g.241586  ORF Transcript_74644/g.241586 Transcript_74644/m.241586 type:complete len:214 (+) Transcript_74644:713-1354(+)
MDACAEPWATVATWVVSSDVQELQSGFQQHFGVSTLRVALEQVASTFSLPLFGCCSRSRSPSAIQIGIAPRVQSCTRVSLTLTALIRRHRQLKGHLIDWTLKNGLRMGFWWEFHPSAQLYFSTVVISQLVLYGSKFSWVSSHTFWQACWGKPVDWCTTSPPISTAMYLVHRHDVPEWLVHASSVRSPRYHAQSKMEHAQHTCSLLVKVVCQIR